MNLYPALKAKMGRWSYYVVKMKMKDIVKEVGFASEIYKNKTLDDAIQRSLNESRVKKEIVQYLGKRTDRFFSSIVVAALGGNPKYYPVAITDDPRFQIFVDTPGIADAFGVLTFNGGQRYFALDGQHRLNAIKTLIEQAESEVPEIPQGFIDEEVSVIMIVREETDEAEFMKSYRRIFSSLNRHARPTDDDTNIIMDEDDPVAILTRRLIIEHEFFVWKGTPDTSPLLKTQGKNLRSGDSYFTTLQTLYGMNEILLHTAERDHFWIRKDYKQFRPAEDELDGMFNELMVYWNAILSSVEVLTCSPTKMREHDAELDDPDGFSDNLLFWPIGQILFARVVRVLLNRRLPDPSLPTEEHVRSCLSVLANVEWDLRRPPWMGLLLIEDPEQKRNRRRRMRNEDRKRALDVAERIILFQVGIYDYSIVDLEDLKVEWHAMLIPQPGRDDVDAMWEVISRPIV